jgi:oligopeptide transport system ATP-binding protein
MAATLSVEKLSVSYRNGSESIEAVRCMSFEVAPGECVGIVGESGSGKTQLLMAAMGLLAGNALIDGSVRFEGEELLSGDSGALNRIRGSRVSMIFQDPMTSLTPHLKIGIQLAEVLVCHSAMSWRDAWSAAERTLERVHISEPRRRLHQYPHELSGGMRQRVMIGMGLLCGPSLLIADEPTSALDVTVQAQIIELLRGLRGQMGMALILVSHDLGVVAGLADRILVMYAGRAVECAPTQVLLQHPRHPYTAELLKCIPSLDGPRVERLATLAGQPPQPGEPLQACAFAPRCPRAADRCRIETPQLLGPSAGSVACHFPLTS